MIRRQRQGWSSITTVRVVRIESRLRSLDSTTVWVGKVHHRARIGPVKQEKRVAPGRSPIVIADEAGGMDWAGCGQIGEGDREGADAIASAAGSQNHPCGSPEPGQGEVWRGIQLIVTRNAGAAERQIVGRESTNASVRMIEAEVKGRLS
jgi:hypothetical protein